MNIHDATEAAYRNGYEQGLKDAVKHGRWELREDEFYIGLSIIQCSECGGEWCFEDVEDVEHLNYKHCPGCGARMEPPEPAKGGV